jgi:predicted NBD/HSP70 family sugar kinase
MRTKAEIRLSIDQKRIVWCLRQYGPTSRIELSRQLGLPATALTRLTRELSAMGVVFEAIPDPKGVRGRPTVPVIVSGHAGYAIGAAVHPGWIDLAAVDFTGRRIAQKSEPFNSKELDVFLQVLKRWMAGLSATNPAFRSKFLGLGIAVPGPTSANDPHRRLVVDWLEGWRNHDIEARCSKVLNLPVWVENDANCAALAELYCGDLLQTASTAIVFFLGHGVGGGVIVNRDFFPGEHLNAGEIGRLFPPNAPRPSGIDLLQCLRAAGANIQSLFKLDEFLPLYPQVFNAWCKRAARQLEIAVNGGVSWLDPGAVVLAGDLPQSVLQDICRRLSKAEWLTRYADLPAPKLHVSSLGSRAVVLGAALLPIHACTIPEKA